MNRPRMLDLFCGAGGCSVGYHRAGWDVTGIDLEPHPDYPFPMVAMDALIALTGGLDLSPFDAVHASPPCQAVTTMSNRYRGEGGRTDQHVNLIPMVRDLLCATGRPWVIENVPGAAPFLRAPILLHGGMFGLGVDRPRLFESSEPLMVYNAARTRDPIGVYGRCHDGRRLWTRADGSEQRAAQSLEEAREAMGIDWMSWGDLTESIPPAYTEFIGGQLLDLMVLPDVGETCALAPAGTGHATPGQPND